MSNDTAPNLRKIEHIVVLMLENRSFDHMLGYLSLPTGEPHHGGGRGDINGLRPDMANEHQGVSYPIRPLSATHIPNPQWDPDHSSHATDHQINDGRMDGFASSYADTLASRGVREPTPDPGVVMGYYDGATVPVYDHLAEHFCVCDQWHSSVPGATWPNRLYAVAGSADGSRDDKPKPPPLYNKASFVRHLDAAGVDWRWYTYDVGTLRCVDHEYLLGHHERFAYLDRVKLGWETGLEESLVVDRDSASFVEDATRGRLRSVSWIDPNFKDVNLAHADSNDDHPPSDVTAGQELVFLVYNAIAAGALWEKTLLIVTYDEHGGFFDHVPPPPAPDDDETTFGRYGIRVPALLISPWVEPRSVCHSLFDHTSIINTILTRFCPPELEHRSAVAEAIHWLRPGHPHYMGKRVAQARHLGEALTRSEPRPAPDRSTLIEWLAQRHADRARTLSTAPVKTPAEERSVSALQASMLSAAKHIREGGLPPGQP